MAKTATLKDLSEEPMETMARLVRLRRGGHLMLFASVIWISLTGRAEAWIEPQEAAPLTSRPKCAALPKGKKGSRKVNDASAMASSFAIALRDQRTTTTPDGRAKMDQLSTMACDIERISVQGKSIQVSYEADVPTRTGTRLLFKVDGADEWFRLTEASTASALTALMGRGSRPPGFTHALVYRTPDAATVLALYRGEPTYAEVRKAAIEAFAGLKTGALSVSVTKRP